MNRARVEPFEWVVAAGAVLLIGVAVPMAGCGDVMVNYDKGRGVLAETTKGCYGTVTAFDVRKQKQIQADVKAHKISPDSATAELDAWLGTFEQAAIVCKAGDELAQAAKNARPIVAAAVDKNKAVADWLARIGVFVASVPESLARLGIKEGGP